MPKTIAPNVLAFSDQLYTVIGRKRRDTWLEDVCLKLVEGDHESPIEHMFCVAILGVCELHRIELNPGPAGVNVWPDGLYCDSQVPLGEYRVDFRVHTQRGGLSKAVIVELDGHDFHDKNKEQRAYEKARDRFFVKSGNDVMHYTGSEVCADPLGVAIEVMQHVDAFGGFPA